MAKNDITGDDISTRTGSKLSKQNFDNNFDAIFRKDLPLNEYPDNSLESDVLCNICGKDLKATRECAWTSCPLNFEESSGTEW